MATLPAHHPHLATHLTDRALTPIISSSLPATPHQPSCSSNKKPPTFSTSPLSASSTSSASSPINSSHHPSAAPLADLTHTALTSYQTAKRLSRGAPLRTLVEYPHAGPVVLHSYLCPMSLALGTPGARGGGARRGSVGSLTTAFGTGEDENENEALMDEEEERGDGGDGHNNNGGSGETQGAKRTRGKDMIIAGGGGAPSPAQADGADDDDDDDPDGPNAPPMLIATVVAPTARDLKEARRAAGRLERIARSLQTQWVVEGPAPGT